MPTDTAISAGSLPPEVNHEHPWLGLLPYKEEHREYFFGRDREVEDILGRIRDNVLTILYGQSGLGKSSLLAAGVVPRLREMGYAPKIIRLRFSDRATLREQMLAVLPNRPPFIRSAEEPDWLPWKAALWELFHRRTNSTSGHPVPVFIFDQFEEIFTLGGQPQFENQVSDWAEQMADLLQNRPPRELAERFAQDRALAEQYHFDAAAVRIVFTLREDYLAQLERWKARLPLLMQNRMALTLLTGPQARQAVLGPAQMGDRSLVSREVAESIVRTVARVPADTPLDQIKAVPPLLSLLCEQLNAARLSDGTPQITAESVRDQSDNILQRFYEDSFLSFPEEHRARIRALLEAPPMITEGGFRNALVRDDAEAQLRRAGVADAKAIFDTLIQRRLITAETRDQMQRLEITHDVLVPLLVRSRKERQDREAKEKAERDAEAAKAEQARLAKERRRLRMAVVGFAALAFAAIGFAVYGWWQAQLARRAEDTAERERNSAVKASQEADEAKQTAIAAASNEKAANEKNASMLHDLSMADYTAAVQHIERDGKRAEGTALLARALKWEPNNQFAAERLYATLATNTTEKLTWPRLILRHENEVWSAQFSPDGTRIVTASKDKTAQMWDAANGKPLGEPLSHERHVTSVQFSPDGTRIVTTSIDKTAQVWDAATGKPLGEPMLHAAPVTSAQFSPDGRRIITMNGQFPSETGEVWLWDATGGKPAEEPIGEWWFRLGITRSAQFSPDGTRIVTVKESDFSQFDSIVQVWDAISGEPQGTPLDQDQPPGEGNGITSAEFSPDGTRIVTISWNNTAQVWDVANGKPLGELMHHEDQVNSAQFSPDSTLIVTTSDDKTARLWYAASGKPVGEPLDKQLSDPFAVPPSVPRIDQLPHEGSVQSAQFSPDGSLIVTASADKTARVWDVASGKPVGVPLRHEDRVTNAQFSPDGSRIITTSADKTARVWDTPSNKPLGEPLVEPLGEENSVSSVQFSPDGSRIVTTSEDKTARVWDVANGKPLGEPMRHEGRVVSVQFSPDGSRVVTTSGDKTVQVWDVASGKLLGEAMRHEDSVNSAQFSPDGSRIVTASDDKSAQVWDSASGRPLGEAMRHKNHVTSAQFSPDGSRIVTASDDKSAQVWDSASGRPLGEAMRHEESVVSAQFSPDGSRIVTMSGGIFGNHCLARVWDAASGKSLHHVGGVQSAQFNPDGTLIVTVIWGDPTLPWNTINGTSLGSTSQVWNVASGKPLGEPMRHEDHVTSAQFSPDGTRIVTTSDDKTARVWDAASGKPLGEPLRHEHHVWSAQFSPDGSSIFTASGDKPGHVWVAKLLVHALPPLPEWMLQMTWAVAGLEFDAYWQIKAIPSDQRLENLRKPVTGDDAWARLARWLALPAAERTLTPESKFTCREIAERARDSGTKEGIEMALHYDPTVPLAHLMLAKFENYKQRAIALREYELKRLPEDAVLWSKASMSLLEQKQPIMAFKAVRKAMALDASLTIEALAFARVLAAFGQKTEALKCWEKGLDDNSATFLDFCDAGYLAAELNQGNKARAIFRMGEKRFPTIPRILRFKGKALLLLNEPAEALTALESYEPILKANNAGDPHPEAIAALSVSRWLTGDKDGALKDYQHLIEIDPYYPKKVELAQIELPDAIKKPMLEVIAETLKRKTELVPKKDGK